MPEFIEHGGQCAINMRQSVRRKEARRRAARPVMAHWIYSTAASLVTMGVGTTLIGLLPIHARLHSNWR